MHNFYRTGHNKQVKNFLVMPCLFEELFILYRKEKTGTLEDELWREQSAI